VRTSRNRPPPSKCFPGLAALRATVVSLPASPAMPLYPQLFGAPVPRYPLLYPHVCAVASELERTPPNRKAKKNPAGAGFQVNVRMLANFSGLIVGAQEGTRTPTTLVAITSR